MSPASFAEARSLLRSFRASKSQKSSFLGPPWPQRSLGEPSSPREGVHWEQPRGARIQRGIFEEKKLQAGVPISGGWGLRVGIGDSHVFRPHHRTEAALWRAAPQGPSGTEPGRHVPGISVCGAETWSRAGWPAGVTDGLRHLQTQLEPRPPHDRAEGHLQGLGSSFRTFF